MSKIHQIQTTLLKLLQKGVDNRLGRGQNYIAEALNKEMPEVHGREVMAAVWGLVSQGLAFIDFSQHSPENWRLVLTDSGTQAVLDEGMNPDNSGEYLTRLQNKVPQMSDIVKNYAVEAVTAYNNKIYLASAVMLGVASEAAFLEVATSFCKWLPATEAKKLSTLLENKKTNYIDKFQEFRKRIEPHKYELPEDISDGMSLFLDSVLDLLRIYRNESGHPTGKRLSREDAKIALEMFARYLEKLYRLKTIFDSKVT